MTVACDNDSFGEEALLYKTYKYTTKTQYYKKTIVYVFEVQIHNIRLTISHKLMLLISSNF